MQVVSVIWVLWHEEIEFGIVRFIFTNSTFKFRALRDHSLNHKSKRLKQIKFNSPLRATKLAVLSTISIKPDECLIKNS